MNAPTSAGPFAPLRQRTFAVLWFATVIGNVGSFMRDVASAWVVTDLSPSPAAVALIQAAATLPIFLLAIPAGVLSDILDRRRFLIGIQVLLAAVSGVLMVLAHTQALTLPWLVVLTLLGGVGAALMGPTWQSIVPELVGRTELRSAVALNSLGINISRAIGPALGGLLLGALGAGVTYGADVLTYVLVLGALLWWRRPAAAPDPLPEHFFSAMRAGFRYTRSSPELHTVLVRTACFFGFAAAVWALLPLVARGQLGGTATIYGLMLGGVGVGAIAGALLLPRLRTRLSPDGLMLGAAIAVAAVMATLAASPPQAVALLLMGVLGAGWIVALTTLNGVAQAILPNWVRGRALAVYLTVFNGAMTFGSLVWGGVAQAIGVPQALLVSAAGLVVVALLARRLALPAGDADLQPSNHWPEPLATPTTAHDRGPVMIQIDYRVDAEDRPAFAEAMQALSHARRRDGAYAWGLSEDPDEPATVTEWFLVESWAEHLRQHHRVSHADADVQQAAHAWHRGNAPPRVRHLIALDVRKPALSG